MGVMFGFQTENIMTYSSIISVFEILCFFFLIFYQIEFWVLKDKCHLHTRLSCEGFQNCVTYVQAHGNSQHTCINRKSHKSTLLYKHTRKRHAGAYQRSGKNPVAPMRKYIKKQNSFRFRFGFHNTPPRSYPPAGVAGAWKEAGGHESGE